MLIDATLQSSDLESSLAKLFELAAKKATLLDRTWDVSNGTPVFTVEGKYTTRSFAEYIKGFDGKPAADEKDRKRAIESIDVAGNAAVARVILDYPTVRFVDYMTLLKIDGEWKIVNKSFYAEPKKKQ